MLVHGPALKELGRSCDHSEVVVDAHMLDRKRTSMKTQSLLEDAMSRACFRNNPLSRTGELQGY